LGPPACCLGFEDCQSFGRKIMKKEKRRTEKMRKKKEESGKIRDS
jgi:hypothetical protein